MLRISSAGVIRSYRSGLMRSRAQLESARQTAMDFRSFRDFGADPAAATRSFQLIRNYGKTDNHIQNSKAVTERLGQIWDSAMDISDRADNIDNVISEAMNGDKDLDARKMMTQTIRGEMESMVQSLNAKYGEEFLFGGAQAGEAPFTLTDDLQLLYHGVNVDTGLDKDGNPFKDPDTGADIPGEEMLQKLADEKLYRDIGLGMTNKNNVGDAFGSADDINAASAMDVSLPGIKLIGYGKDADGNPKNAISQLREICNELEKDPLDVDKLSKMRTQFGDTRNLIREGIATVDTRASFVKSNTERLEKNLTALNQEIVDLTQVDPALAYSEFAFAQYYYNSALKIGNSILDQSFIDYMR